jgi:hypothetical protein
MLSCLIDTIQLWDECSARNQPNYVDELPGISNDFLRDIARSQDADIPELFTRLARNAARKVEEDLRGHLSGRMKIGSIVANQRAGIYPINPANKTAPGGVTAKGLAVYYNGTAGLQIVISAVHILPSQSGSVTVSVLDALNPSRVIGTVTGTAVAGELLTIPCSISASSETTRWGVIVSIPAGFGTKESRIELSGCDTCGNETKCLDGYTNVSGAVVTNSGAVNNRIDTGGISVDYSINCDLAQYICRSKASFASIMRYAFGVSAVEEALYSSRVNNTTVIDPERTAMLGDRLVESYNVALKSVVQHWTMPNDLCFCTQPLTGWKTVVP